MLPECSEKCGRRTDFFTGKCRVCSKLCMHCHIPIDAHEEGKLRNCLIKESACHFGKGMMP